MRFCAISLLLIPLFLFAQEPGPAPSKPAAPTAEPPAAVDQALRARATAFLQYQVEGNFRKAYDLVAEDSKDFYFAIEKTKILSFKVDEITYADDFAKATVRATAIRKTNTMGREFEIPSVTADSWKLEDGKWTWYHDPKLDTSVPFFAGLVSGGGSPAPAEAVDPKLLPKDTSPEAVVAAAAKLVQPATFSKASVTFTQGKAAVEEVVFHNSNRGQIQVSASVEGRPEDITVEPAKTLVNALADLTLKIHYNPGGTTRRNARVRLEIQPFRTVYVLPVTFVPETARQKQ
jgi:hypothetical protein